MLCRVSKICLDNFKHKHFSLITQLNTSTSASVQGLNEKWDLYAGVLVERLPVVAKTLTPLERQFQEHLWQVEFEKSLKSNNELQFEREARQAELIKQGKLEVELDDSVSQQTAQDLKDACLEELKKFQRAARTTADDVANNLESHNRKLEDILYLLTEQTFGSNKYLLLPQGPRLDGETMRQAAERVLRERCGTSLEVKFYGNSPCGFYKYKYPKAMRNEGSAVGAKVFYFRAALKHGNVDAQTTKAFEWVEKGALEAKLNNATYNDSVQKFLI